MFGNNVSNYLKFLNRSAAFISLSLSPVMFDLLFLRKLTVNCQR